MICLAPPTHTDHKAGALAVSSALPSPQVLALVPTPLLIPTRPSQQEHATFLSTMLSVGRPGLWVHTLGVPALHLLQPLHVLRQHHRHELSSPQVIPAGQSTEAGRALSRSPPVGPLPPHRPTASHRTSLLLCTRNLSTLRASDFCLLSCDHSVLGPPEEPPSPSVRTLPSSPMLLPAFLRTHSTGCPGQWWCCVPGQGWGT